MEQTGDISLAREVIRQLRACGHFLHYKMGGCMGKRRILLALFERTELLQRELQDIVGIQSGSLSEIVIKMEADGLIQKVRSEKDGRHFLLRLTPEGVAQAERAGAIYDTRVETMMACLTPEELRELHELLDVVLAQWGAVEFDSEFPPMHHVKNARKDI